MSFLLSSTFISSPKKKTVDFEGKKRGEQENKMVHFLSNFISIPLLLLIARIFVRKFRLDRREKKRERERKGSLYGVLDLKAAARKEERERKERDIYQQQHSWFIGTQQSVVCLHQEMLHPFWLNLFGV